MSSSRFGQQGQDEKMPGGNNETSNDREREREGMASSGVDDDHVGQDNNRQRTTDGNGSHDEYTDRSSEGIKMPLSTGVGSSESTVPIKYRKFPCKLYAMLESPEFEPYISWMPHGRSWKIHNNEAVETYVLPMGKPHLHERVSRLGINKKKPIGTEPDLFSYPPLPPLERLSSMTTRNSFQQPPSVAVRRVGEAQDSAARSINVRAQAAVPAGGSISQPSTLNLPSSLMNFDARGLLLATAAAATPSSTAPTSSTSTSTSGNASLESFVNGSSNSLHQQVLHLLQHSKENSHQQREENRLLHSVIQSRETRIIPPADTPSRNSNDVPLGLHAIAHTTTSNTDGRRIDGGGGITGEAPSAAALTLTRELFVELAARELASRQIQQSYDQSASSATLLASLFHSNNNQSSTLLSSGNSGASTASSTQGLPGQQQQQQQRLPFASRQSGAALEALLSRYVGNLTTTTTTTTTALRQNLDQQQLQQLALLVQQQVTGPTGRGDNDDDDNNDDIDEGRSGQVNGTNTGKPRREQNR